MPELGGDAALLARLRAGDRPAFDSLVHTFGGPLIRHATRIIGSVDYAQEIVQDVFLQLWRDRANVEPTWDIASYLYWLTRNRAIDVARSEHASNQRDSHWATELIGDTNLPHNTGESSAEAAELRSLIWTALSDVPTRCREVFMLVWDRQLPYKEIAHILGLAEPTVRSQVSRALKRLAEVLGPRYKDL